jgi:hypothetical protein
VHLSSARDNFAVRRTYSQEVQKPRKRSVFGVFQFSKREKRIPAKKVTGPQKKKNFYVRSIIFGTIIGQCTTWGNEGMRKQE